MVANHIHHALEQVHELRHKILERQRFRGYSGSARIVSGILALLAAGVMSSRVVPQTPCVGQCVCSCPEIQETLFSIHGRWALFFLLANVRVGCCYVLMSGQAQP